jgi:hypothetical protein
MRRLLTATTILLGVVPVAGQSQVRSLKVGAVYCVSQAAIEEHLQATADADTDRVRDILSTRKICDYAQGPVDVTVLTSPPTAKWTRVRLANTDGSWRKGSKVTLPNDATVWVRKNSIQ